MFDSAGLMEKPAGSCIRMFRLLGCLFAQLGEVILEMSICSLITKDCYQNLIVHVVDVSTLWSPARPLLRPLRVENHIMQSLAHCRAGFLCLFLFMSEIYNLISAPSL